jgi:hypothetical protein
MTRVWLGWDSTMRPLTVPDAENVILALQDEIRRSDESRYDHRLHGR